MPDRNVVDLVDYMVRPLVSYPDDISIVEVEGTASVLIELKVHEDDVDIVRGDDREMIRNLQQVVTASGGSQKVILELIEEDGAGSEE